MSTQPTAEQAELAAELPGLRLKRLFLRALVVSLLPLVALVALAHRLLERFSLSVSSSQEGLR